MTEKTFRKAYNFGGYDDIYYIASCYMVFCLAEIEQHLENTET
jgi:hypothetical protein